MHQLSILSKQFCFIVTNHNILMKGHIPQENIHNFTISTVSTSVLSNSSYLDKKQRLTYLNKNLIDETRTNILDKSRNKWNQIPFRNSVKYQKSPTSPSTKYQLQSFLRNTSYFSVEENQPKVTQNRLFRADYQQTSEKTITFNRKTGNYMENKDNTYEKLFEKINKKQALINELKELSKGSITEHLRTTQDQIKSPINKYNFLKKTNKCTEQHERGYQSQPSKNKYQDNSSFKRKKLDFHRSQAYTIKKAQSPLKTCIRQKIKTQIPKESYHYDDNHHYKKNPQLVSKDQLFRKYKQSLKRVSIYQSINQPTSLKLVFTKAQSAVQNQKQKFYSQRYTYQLQNFVASLTSRNDNYKNIYDIRQYSDTKRIKNNVNYFTHKKVQISDFYLLKTLGEGKFGTVHQAILKATKSIFAIKKIPKKIIKQNLMIEQLIKQIKLQSLCRHQNILELYGFFDDKDFIYLVLQYMSQGTLFHVLKKKRKLTEEEASRKLRDTAKAIAYMHEKGIAHRDIKPQNIVIQSGIGKICDFGWATLCDTERRKTYCGTFDYAAPQILQGSQYGISVDLWCLGILAYELLTGKAPFYHISRKQTMKKIMNVQNQAISFPSYLSKNAISFISNLLKKDPQQRMSGSNLLSHPFLLQKKQHP